MEPPPPKAVTASIPAGKGQLDKATLAEIASARRNALSAVSFGTTTRHSDDDPQGCGGIDDGDDADITPAARAAAKVAVDVDAFEWPGDGETPSDASSSWDNVEGSSAKVSPTLVSTVLRLDHGATHDAQEGPRVVPAAVRSGARLGPDGNGAGEGRAARRERRVVIGVMTFESLREGELAVSSLFVRDETGEKREPHRLSLSALWSVPPCRVGVLLSHVCALAGRSWLGMLVAWLSCCSVCKAGCS